jgi:hypothetical protein
MKEMRLPIGAPSLYVPGQDLRPEGLFAILTVNITAIDTPKAYYAKVALGESVFDTIALDSLTKHCGIHYEILRGYVWRTGDSAKLEAYVDELYKKKSSAVGPMRDIYKLCLNSVYGRCLKRAYKTMKKKEFDSREKAEEYAEKNHFILDSIEELEDDRWAVILNWCLDKSFNHAHVGVAILSSARAFMDNIFAECDRLGIDVKLHNCDCIAIDTDKVPLIEHLIGPGLGELKMEASGAAHIVNSKRYNIGSHIRPRTN